MGKFNPGSPVTVQLNELNKAAVEGTFYVANSNVTGAVAITQTSSSSTTAALVVSNPCARGEAGAVSIYMNYLKLRQGATVYIAGTSFQYYFELRPVQFNLTTIAPYGVNSESNRPSRARVSFGVSLSVGNPGAGARLFSPGVLSTTLPVVDDQWFLSFGSPTHSNNFLTGGTAAKNTSINLHPIIIAPGWSLVLFLWAPNSTAGNPTFEFDMGYMEYPTNL